MKPVLQPVSAAGIPIGEAHHNAKLSDREVELVRKLHEQGFGYRRLAAKFEVSRTMIKMIVTFEKRATAAAGWRLAPTLRLRRT